MARKRAENRKESLGFPGFVKPVFTEDNCTRGSDVYVKWLTWLDDWEMHRNDNVSWCMVGLQPWNRALKNHVQRSHEKALANGRPSDVTLLEHI
ncbi:hypothetical protein TNCV_1616351 [Trichonephila clavipes]|nr:hypothetical protein TNCV_1616351 [Trichonephila clavipes]